MKFAKNLSEIKHYTYCLLVLIFQQFSNLHISLLLPPPQKKNTYCSRKLPNNLYTKPARVYCSSTLTRRAWWEKNANKFWAPFQTSNFFPQPPPHFWKWTLWVNLIENHINSIFPRNLSSLFQGPPQKGQNFWLQAHSPHQVFVSFF